MWDVIGGSVVGIAAIWCVFTSAITVVGAVGMRMYSGNSARSAPGWPVMRGVRSLEVESYTVNEVEPPLADAVVLDAQVSRMVSTAEPSHME